MHARAMQNFVKRLGKFLKLVPNPKYQNLLGDLFFYLRCFKNPAYWYLYLVFITVNFIVNFDVSMEIYHGEFFSGNFDYTR